MNPYKKLFIFVFALGLFASCNTASTPTENEQEQTVEESNQYSVAKSMLNSTNMSLGQVVNHDFYEIVQATGAIEVPMSSKADISTMVAGYVSSLPYLVGEQVKKGQLLMELQNPDFIAMQQSYLEAKESLVFLKAEYDRQKLLADENISSKKNFEKASSDYKLKQAQYNGLKETLKLLNVDLVALEKGTFSSTIHIYAPLSGFISSLDASIGTYVAPGDVVMTLINTDHKHIELEVFEKNVLSVAKGQRIRFRVPDAGNTYYEGNVFQINKAIDKNNRTLLVHGHLEKEQGNFLQGMYVEAEIFTNKINGIAVPTRAVIEEDGKNYILLYKGETESDVLFTKIEVETGRVTEQFTQIVNPNLKPGVKILDKGVFRIMS